MNRPDRTVSPPPAPVAPAEGDQAAIYCPQCGYDLRARTSQICPECGLRIDAFDGTVIPWVDRDRLGRMRAMLGTLAIVLWHAERVCREVVRPVRAGDMLAFQAAVVAWAVVWTLLTMAGVELAQPGLIDALGNGLGLWVSVTLVVGWALLLWFGCSAVTIFFDAPQDRAEHGRRCVALARLTCAPLVLIPLPLLLTAVAMVAVVRTRGRVPSLAALILGIIALALLLALPMLVLNRAVIFHRRLVRQTGRLLAMCVLLPLIWLLAGVVLLGLLPGVVFLGRLVFATLR